MVSKMSQFSLVVYLMTAASIPRITHALLKKGFTVEPALNGYNLTHHCKDGVSIILVVHITPNDKNLDSRAALNTMLATLLQDELEVPYYGSMVIEGDAGFTVGTGKVKEVKRSVVSVGPYRTNGEVIPFPEKDDGIIDG